VSTTPSEAESSAVPVAAEPPAPAVPAPAPAAPAERPKVPHMGLIVILVCSAFVVILNETVISIALPDLIKELNITARSAQWLTTAFALTMAVVIPVTGFLIERWKTRTIFITAMSLFTAGTLLAGIAPGFGLLLFARVVQASGTAMMMPLLMTTILVLVPMEVRGRVMGFVGIVMAVAPALGPTVAGVVLQYMSWRSIFFIVLPFAVALLLVGIFILKNVGEQNRRPIDLLSIPLSALGFGGLVYALSSLGASSQAGGAEAADQAAADGVVVWIALAVGAVSLALFVWRQFALIKGKGPLLDLRVFGSKTFTIGIGVMMIAFAALLGTGILLPLYMQQVRALDTVTVGLILLPGGLLMGLLGPIVGILFDRYGARTLMVCGSAVVVLALFGVSTFNASTPVWLIVVVYTCLSGGLAFLFTPVFTAALGLLPPHLYSHGSATLSTLQQVAGAAGTALLVAVFSTVSAAASSSGAGALPGELAGLQWAFSLAAALALAAFVLSFFMPGHKATLAAMEAAKAEGMAPVGH